MLDCFILMRKNIIILFKLFIFIYSGVSVAAGPDSLNNLSDDVRNITMKSFLTPKEQMNLALTSKANFKNAEKIPGYKILRTNLEKLKDTLTKKGIIGCQVIYRVTFPLGGLGIVSVGLIDSICKGPFSSPFDQVNYGPYQQLINTAVKYSFLLVLTANITDRIEKHLQKSIEQRDLARTTPSTAGTAR